MYHNNQKFINDSVIAIPYFSDKNRMSIIADLENKKRRGFIIKGIGWDEERQCITYSEPNKESLKQASNEYI